MGKEPKLCTGVQLGTFCPKLENDSAQWLVIFSPRLSSRGGAIKIVLHAITFAEFPCLE